MTGSVNLMAFSSTLCAVFCHLKNWANDLSSENRVKVSFRTPEVPFQGF